MSAERTLMRGSNVIAESAILAGCRFFAGYPITPQNELPEHMAARMQEVGGTFIQGESETASINMVMGAAMTGARAMTSSSSPGVSLKQEAISFMCGMELPAVVVNVMRGGPGLGSLAPSQGDYFQSTRGGGHGDYKLLVLAPGNLQELADLTYKAFDLADKYRNPVMVVGDGLMGQMMEPVVLPDPLDPASLPVPDWVLNGAKGREKRKIYSMILGHNELLEHNYHLEEKYNRMEAEDTLWESLYTEDAEVVVVAYATAARVMEGAVNRLRQEGHKVGLFRPITLQPFPKEQLRQLAGEGRRVAVFELSMGQMVEDVALSVGQRSEIYLYGLPASIPTPTQAREFLYSVLKGDGKVGRRYMV